MGYRSTRNYILRVNGLHVSVSIETDNAAFDPDPIPELDRIDRRIREQVREGRDEGRVIDVNGNKVGSWEVSFPR